jgi:hypothetical protein
MSKYFIITFRSADWQRRPAPGDTDEMERACRPACPGRSGSCAVCRARMLPLLRRRAGPARPLGRDPLADPARPVGFVHPAGTGSTHPAATGICNKMFYYFSYFIMKEQKIFMRDKLTFLHGLVHKIFTLYIMLYSHPILNVGMVSRRPPHQSSNT